jgi:hypothetical protein
MRGNKLTVYDQGYISGLRGLGHDDRRPDEMCREDRIRFCRGLREGKQDRHQERLRWPRSATRSA